MAFAFYKTFLDHLMEMAFQGAAAPTGTLKIAGVSAAYTADITDTGHDFWDDVSANLVHGPVALSSVTTVNRVLDAADLSGTFTDPGSGTTTQLVIFFDTATPATSRLVGVDTAPTGSLISDGVDDNVVFNASGILKLGGA